MQQTMTPLYSLGGIQKPDQKWTHIDSNNHKHQYDSDKLPTLEYVEPITEEYWCDDCNDSHDQIIKEGCYKCKLCGEKVTPGYVNDTSPYIIYGPVEYYKDGIIVTKEEFNTYLQEQLELCGKKE